MTLFEMTLKLKKEGGQYLGAARSWIQTRFINGEHVTWGSRDILKGNPIVVADIEDVALISAACALTNNFKPENRICLLCTNKTKYPWIECALRLNYKDKIIARKCEYFHLKKDIAYQIK